MNERAVLLPHLKKAFKNYLSKDFFCELAYNTIGRVVETHNN
jgi:hypothetical protein